MPLNATLERARLSCLDLKKIDGPLCFDAAVLDTFLKAPFDVLPSFEGPPGSLLKGGRGKDHPRYGRFIYAFARHYKPQQIVEIGSFAGGTAVAWGRALQEIGSGRLTCVDNDTYAKTTYPAVTRRNLLATGLSAERFELLNGDSAQLLPELARTRAGGVDIYLVDGDHTYEGALRDLRLGAPMVRSGGFILVHDVDRDRRMDEQTPEHPHPVYEALQDFLTEHPAPCTILRFIRKHLAIVRKS